jgi:hypothetical protein
MSVGVKAKRWGLRLAIGAAVLWILWVLAGSPWTPFGLWYDAVRHEAVLRQTAKEVLCCRTAAGSSDNEKAVADLGYKSIQVDNGVVLFVKYDRFMGKGILGLAYSEGEPPKDTSDYDFFGKPPHWPWLHMPQGFYILGGK